MNKTRLIIYVIMLGAFLASSAFFYKYLSVSRQHKLQIMGQINDFNLQGSDGKNVTLADLKGMIWVADFMFTTCSGICPMMTKNLASLHRSYKQEKDVLMVSISVNPETDTPEVLKAYAKKHNADAAQWLFLRGSNEAIKKIAVESFKLGSVDEPVFHSSYFTLVDRQGRIRGYYDGTDDEGVRKLFKDLAILKKEH